MRLAFEDHDEAQRARMYMQQDELIAKLLNPVLTERDGRLIYDREINQAVMQAAADEIRRLQQLLDDEGLD